LKISGKELVVVREGVRAVYISKCLLDRIPGPPCINMDTAVTRGLFHSGLGLDVHHPDGGLAQRSQGHPPPTTISRAPTSTVRDVLWTPIAAAYTIPNVLVVSSLAYYFQGSESHYKYFLTTVMLLL
jgi:hypothetical protein